MTEPPRVIGLCGYAGVGKDEVAKILAYIYGYHRVAFADALKTVLYAVNPSYRDIAAARCLSLAQTVDAIGWAGAKKQPEVRRMLQDLGAAMRAVDPGVWVHAVWNQTFRPPEARFVIPDVRYRNEVAVADTLWRIERPGYGPVNDHASETQLDGHPVGRTILNDGSLGDLADKVAAAMEES